jgi:lysophospholipase L1-like esterase
VVRTQYFYNRILLSLLFCFAALLAASGATAADAPAGDDPTRWEDAIKAFEATAQATPEPHDAVVFVGSSSIRFWSTLKEDMSPIPVIQRGFGGSRLGDSAYYAERLVNAYQPHAVVLFAGTNDITPENSKTPEQLLASYKEFVAKVRKGQPNVPIYFIEITPSPLRWGVWKTAQETNRLIRKYAAIQKNLRTIDLAPFLLGANGEPDVTLYRDDRLHMTSKGYLIWKREVRARLLKDMPELEAVGG